MSAWNFATIWEIVADELPDAPAVIQGERVVAWGEFDRRADGVARTLLDRGAVHQDKVAQYLYNCPEYLESMFARVQGRRSSRSTRTTATPTTSWSTCGTTPTPWPWSSTARFVERIERHPRPAPEGADLAVGRRRQRPLPRLGRRLRGRPPRPPPSGSSPPGAAAATTSPPVHRRHDRHAQGRDVAPGRPGRARSMPASQPAARRRRPTTTRCATCCAPTRPGPRCLPAPADARHRPVHDVHLA